ncbi:MAG: class I SAM-dependent methyltransferase [Rhizobacter sp.]|nr:class I SAM-dependent methyltransferase [Chlorobiales bacterium]
MFQKSPKYYGLVYGYKNYKEESAVVKALLQHLNPNYRTYLDIACGTGEHAKYLSETYQVDGLDLHPDFVAITQAKLPKGEVFVADMTDFDLGKKYDVVSCIYSSIGYARTPEKLARALRAFKKHLNKGGVILIEPWARPDTWKTGEVRTFTGESDGIKILRMSETETTADGLSCVILHHLVGEAGKVEYFAERHEMGLFSPDDFKRAFEEAELEVDYHADFKGLSERGLYIGREKS